MVGIAVESSGRWVWRLSSHFSRPARLGIERKLDLAIQQKLFSCAACGLAESRALLRVYVKSCPVGTKALVRYRCGSQRLSLFDGCWAMQCGVVFKGHVRCSESIDFVLRLGKLGASSS